MPDKERERVYLTQLLEALSLTPEEEPSQGEAPDFRVRVNGRQVGIEITGYHAPPGPGEQRYREARSLRERAMEIARRHFRSLGGPALYVKAIFHDRYHLTKKRSREIGVKLAEALLGSRWPETVQERIDLGWPELPPEVAVLWAHGSVDGTDELWTPSVAGWVGSVDAVALQGELDRKAHVAARILESCDEAWLAVVNDVFNAEPVKISEEALAACYVHPFTKAIWLEYDIPRAHVLRTKG